jgi:hypothetical protein
MSAQDLLFTLILSSAWCIGVHVFVKNFLIEVFDYDINEHWERDYVKIGNMKLPGAEKQGIPEWIKLILKPLFACPYCMASIHGTVIFFAFVLGYLPLIMWIPFCICLCGLNYFLTQFFTE